GAPVAWPARRVIRFVFSPRITQGGGLLARVIVRLVALGVVTIGMAGGRPRLGPLGPGLQERLPEFVPRCGMAFTGAEQGAEDRFDARRHGRVVSATPVGGGSG